MYLFKFVFAFLSIGGAGYALLRIEEAPVWLKVTSLMMAFAAVIIALPDLPRGFDAIEETGQKIKALFPHPAPSPSPVAPLSPSSTPSPLPSIPAATPSPYPSPLPPPAAQTEPTPTLPPSPSLKSNAAPGFDALEDNPVEINPHLKIYEGASYRLAQGKTYYLDAPFGYTVGYFVLEGSINVYRDGQLRAECTDHGFKTFARVSRYSVVACSATAALKVAYIRFGNEIR